MKHFLQRSVVLAALFVLGASQLAFAGKSERNQRRIFVDGRVLKIDQKDRTLLVSDRCTKTLYLVTVPEGANFRITFGAHMRLDYPEFSHVHKYDMVKMICTRTGEERLATLDDGTKAIAVVAIR